MVRIRDGLFALAGFVGCVVSMEMDIFPPRSLYLVAIENGLIERRERAPELAQLYRTFTPTVDVVFVGDSLVMEGPWHDLFPDIAVANRGIGGNQTSDVLDRLDEGVLALKPEVIVLMVGINDLLYSREPGEIIRDYMRIIDRATDAGVEVIIQSLIQCTGRKCPDNGIGGVNRLLRKRAGQRGIRYVDLDAALSGGQVIAPENTTDGVHLTAQGYGIWARTLAPLLEEFRRSDRSRAGAG